MTALCVGWNIEEGQPPMEEIPRDRKARRINMPGMQLSGEQKTEASAAGVANKNVLQLLDPKA